MRIGIDVGGTKIEVIALDEKGNTLLRERIATPKNDYHATLQAIHQLINISEERTKQTGSVGIGIPGTISPHSKQVKNANSTWLNGQNLQGDLELLLERKIRIANDANCFTVSEAVDGAATGAHIVFGVIIGTGCGGGLAINGQVHNGSNGVAGEWGHNPLPRITEMERQSCEPCYCGHQGCIEQFLSGTGFAQQYRYRSGVDLKSQTIIEQMRNGDQVALACFELYLEQFARSLAHIVGVLDPDVIVLGGGMSNVDEIYIGMTERIAKYTFGNECHTPVLQAKHGDSSGVRGAAWLWPSTK